MDKIISLSESSPSIVDIDGQTFVKFMQNTPIWEFFKICQAKYLPYSVEEKTTLIWDYYNKMSNGKRNLLFCVFGFSYMLAVFNLVGCYFIFSLDNKSFDSGANFSGLPPQRKANIMSLSKEISKGDRAIRSKVVVANIDGEKKSSEAVWEKDGFFGTINPDLSIHKKDFPENALVYINQAYLTVKDGEVMIYFDYVILGQLIALKNPPEDLDEAVKNEKRTL